MAMADGAVLDASALIALLLDEPGSDVVRAAMAGASIGTVNLCEAIGYLVEHGWAAPAAAKVIARTQLGVVSFDAGLAEDAAALKPLTRSHGLSLGDRACLATAKRLGVRALTADRAWQRVKVDVPITLIR